LPGQPGLRRVSYLGEGLSVLLLNDLAGDSRLPKLLSCQDRTPANVSVSLPAFRAFPPACRDGFRCQRRRTAIDPAAGTLNAVAQAPPIPAFRPYRVRFSVVRPKPITAPPAFEIPVFASARRILRSHHVNAVPAPHTSEPLEWQHRPQPAALPSTARSGIPPDAVRKFQQQARGFFVLPRNQRVNALSPGKFAERHAHNSRGHAALHVQDPARYSYPAEP
jgi:hypothetical protein